MTSADVSKAIIQLQEWYISNCDGDWEHQFGVSLTTLDNPGWSVTIDLNETSQEHQAFEELKIDYEDESLWIIVKKEGSKLEGACGPSELGKMLSIITTWLKPMD